MTSEGPWALEARRPYWTTTGQAPNAKPHVNITISLRALSLRILSSCKIGFLALIVAADMKEAKD